MERILNFRHLFDIVAKIFLEKKGPKPQDNKMKPFVKKLQNFFFKSNVRFLSL
jgi:hypothetical protein